MRHIIVKENEPITIIEDEQYILQEKKYITRAELDEIFAIVKDKELNLNFIKLKPESISFYNYVGYIRGEKFSIEILPKTYIDKDKVAQKTARKILVDMIIYSEDFKIKNYDFGFNQELEGNLYEIFANIFLEELKDKIFKGIYREYINFDDNLNAVRGKIQLNDNIKNIIRNRNLISCSFDEFSIDNSLNRILKFGIKKIIKSIKDFEKIKNLRQILIDFEDVSDISEKIAKETMIVFSRRNIMYELSYNLVKLLINDCITYGTGETVGLGILFEMHSLFEKYIGKAISENVPREVELQATGKHVLKKIGTGEEIMGIKPDIIIYDDYKKENIILDTKWKFISDGEIDSRDLYQMYVYANIYEVSKKIILLYPEECQNSDIGKMKENKYHILPSKNKILQTFKIRYDSIEHTVEDIKSLGLDD